MAGTLRLELDPGNLPERFESWEHEVNKLSPDEIKKKDIEDLISIRLEYRYIPVFPPPERVRLDGVSEERCVNGHSAPMRLFCAKSLDDYLAFIEYYCAYAKLSSSISRCYFRGQTKDYGFSLLPAAERSFEFAQSLRNFGPETMGALDAWQRVLKAEGVEIEQRRSVVSHTEIGQEWHTVDSSLVSRMTRNLEFMGILQHYGFPTFALDVTDDPGIALWFAMHKAVEEDGRVRFHRLDNSANAGPMSPLVYVFLGVDHESGEVPVVDLHTLEYFQGKSPNRPFTQRATVLPKYRTEFIQNLYDRTMMDLEPGLSPPGKFREILCRKGASGAVRVEFPVEELQERWPALSGELLFPSRDQLYNALEDANVPYLYRVES